MFLMVKMNPGWCVAMNWEVCGQEYKYLVRSLGFGLLRVDPGRWTCPSLCGPGKYIHQLLQEILFLKYGASKAKCPTMWLTLAKSMCHLQWWQDKGKAENSPGTDEHCCWRNTADVSLLLITLVAYWVLWVWLANWTEDHWEGCPDIYANDDQVLGHMLIKVYVQSVTGISAPKVLD